MHRLEVTLPGLASSVPPARHFVVRTLEAWGLEELSWTAALVVTELAANAALHAGTDFTVAVGRDGDRVRVEVRDRSAAVPRQRTHGLESTTGRGLRLVGDLSDAWGVDRDAAGKTVWSSLAVAAQTGADDDSAADVPTAALLQAFADDLDEPDAAGQPSAMRLRAAA